MVENHLTRPKFSIVVPCYNDGALAVDAVRSCLGQLGEAAFEVLLVDDGSTDGSLQRLCNEFHGEAHVRIISQKNSGPASARNNGVRNAEGDFILFLDADDRIGCRYLSSVQVALLGTVAAARQILVVSPYSYFASEEAAKISVMDYFRAPRLVSEWWGFNRFCILTGNCFPISSCVVSRDVFDSVSGFDEGLTHHEDWDFWIKVLNLNLKVIYSDASYDSATYIRMRQGLMSNKGAMKQSQRQVLLRYTPSWPGKILRSRVGWFVARLVRVLIISVQLLLIGRDQHLKAN